MLLKQRGMGGGGAFLQSEINLFKTPNILCRSQWSSVEAGGQGLIIFQLRDNYRNMDDM